MTTVVYPGTFDPITCGHLDIITRAAATFPHVTVALLKNANKQPVFTVSQRLELIRRSVAHLSNVEVDAFTGLLVSYMRFKGAGLIVRGLRSIADFECEAEQAAANRHLAGVETTFFMASSEYSYLSSSMVRDIGSYGGALSGMVPSCIEEEVRAALLDINRLR